MSPLRSPLYRRLLIWFLAANIAALLLGIFVTDRVVHHAMLSEPDWATLAQAADTAYESGGPGALSKWADDTRDDGVEAALYENGRPLLDRPVPPPIQHVLSQLLAQDDILLRPRPEVSIAGQRVTGTDGVARQLVAMRGPRPPHARRQFFLITQILLSMLVIGVVGWWIARGVAKPVEALREATRRMAMGELSARVGPRWTAARDELGQLARDFDGMAERIESLVTHERGVLQDLSHELRSPLARLHLILDLAQRDAGSGNSEAAAPHFRRAEHEISRLDRMIGEMLALSRMEADLPGMNRERIALSLLARDRVEAAGLEAEARQVRLEIATRAGVDILGSPALLERALDNLLANAIKFSPIGGTVEVAVTTDGDRADLLVRDHGPGVPAADIDALFRPFFRGANASRADGHGLGLAIVERIAQAHGGQVLAENAVDGGLRVRLRLPLAGASAQAPSIGSG